jgi:hypothetical protein
MRTRTRSSNLIIGPTSSPVAARPKAQIGAIYTCNAKGCGASYYKPAISGLIPHRSFLCTCGNRLNESNQKIVADRGPKPFTIKQSKLKATKKTKGTNFDIATKWKPEYVFKIHRASARVRGLDHDLDIMDYQRLMDANARCTYCGATHQPVAYGRLVFDRIDNTKGYTKSNVCISCSTCNALKSNKSATSLVAHAQAIINHAVNNRITAMATY